jgi:hypothetical protein
MQILISDNLILTQTDPLLVYPIILLVTKIHLNPASQKIINDQSECLIILPLWPTQIWYPLVMELLIQRPVLLPRKRKLLSIPQTDKIHPLQNQMRLKGGNI